MSSHIRNEILSNDMSAVLSLPEAEAIDIHSTIQSASAETYKNKGNTFLSLGQLDEAEQSYRQALVLNPEYGESYNNLGNVLRLSKRLEESEQAFSKALIFMPNSAEVHSNFGNLLMDLERFEDAEKFYRQAITIKPDYYYAYNGLGLFFLQTRNFDDAEECFRQAITIKPDCSEAYNNLGLLFALLGHLEDAEHSYFQSLSFTTNKAKIYFNLSLIYLIQGRYGKGFEFYEQRFGAEYGRSLYKIGEYFIKLQNCRRWNGESLDGKSLLIIMEQGAGDNIMMMRYLPLLSKFSPKRLIVYCEPNLQQLFHTMCIVDEVVPTSESLPIDNIDCYCAGMSLPYLFNTQLDTIPSTVPYLFLSNQENLKWRNSFKNIADYKVGLVWAGNRQHRYNNIRSISLSQFSPLLDIKGVQFISLQKGEDSCQLKNTGWDILDLMDLCHDYLDTASLVSKLDLVISVDTSVAHLAGAMGKPVWLLNSFAGEWRWMLEREDSPWYPTVRIFRQDTRSDWSKVMQRVVSELQNIIDMRRMDKNDYINQGLALLASKDFVDAAGSFERAVEIYPENTDAHNNLGIAYFEIGFREDAKYEFKTATRLSPSNAEAWKNLGKAIRDTRGSSETAARCFRKALSITPDFDDAWMMLGTTLLDRGRSKDAVKCFRNALKLNPNNCDAHSNLLFVLNYIPEIFQSDIYFESLKWNDIHAAEITEFQHIIETDLYQNKRIRVGYVSGDFKRHPVGYHLLPVLAAHDCDSFEVYCYSTICEQDDLTEQMRGYVAGWRDISRLSDDEAARLICDDFIDILIDLSGHSNGSRLRLFAHKPAPVQVSWLGYFNTTGVKAIDYIISDETTIPVNDEQWFSEKILRLPGSRFCYSPPEYAPLVSKPPVLKNGNITFGSFNNIAKLTTKVIELWSQVLIAVPDSRLILKWSTLGRKKERDRLIKIFVKNGIDAGRLILRGKSSHVDMLMEYGEIDIALDPFPFSGGMTSCEALWMGVPVLTLLGDKPAGRQTAGFLQTIGLSDWVTFTQEQFVSRAIAAASEHEKLKIIRLELREKMAASTLCDGARFTRNLESTFKEIYDARF